MFQKYLFFALLAGASVVQSAHADSVPFDSDRWTFVGEATKLVQYDGRPALYMSTGAAILENEDFSTGTIEFDILMTPARGFSGLAFHAGEGRNYEHFYLRHHQSGNPDANQYLPVFNGVSSWQIFYGPQWSVPTDYSYRRWTHVKVIVGDSRAEIYIDGDEPVLTVDLMHPNKSGALALTSNLAGAFFADFEFTPSADPEMHGDAPITAEMPDNIVAQWQISSSFPESQVADSDTLSEEFVAGLNWTALDVEANGIANMARVQGLANGNDTAIAKLTLNSDSDRMIRIPFGYSDKVRVYVNGRVVWDGDDTYQTRDYRYLGTVGRFYAIHAPLNAGRNEIMFAVTESFGGWAVTAELPPTDGVSLER